MASCQEKIDSASEYTLPPPRVVLTDLCQQKGLSETIIDKIAASPKYQDLEAASYGEICPTNKNPWGNRTLLQRINAWALEIRVNQCLWMREESMVMRLRLVVKALAIRNKLFPADQNPMPETLLYSLINHLIDEGLHLNSGEK